MGSITKTRSELIREIRDLEEHLAHARRALMTADPANELPATSDHSTDPAAAPAYSTPTENSPVALNALADAHLSEAASDRLILDSIACHVAVLDSQGVIIQTNEAWQRFARENGAGLALNADVGTNYLEVCRQAAGNAAESAQEGLAGLRALLDGNIDHFDLEYSCHSPTTERWFLMHAAPLHNDCGRIVIIHLDISGYKRIEDALQQRILALTRPLGDVSTIKFEDLFDLEEIQKIQDAFAEATGVASVITDLQGRPITRPSNFCRLCLNVIRKTPKGFANCMRSDAELGKMNPNGPTMQPCLSGGLWDGGTSICIGDQHIANWLIGQVIDDTQNEEQMLAYGREIGADPDEFRSAMAEVTRMPHGQFAKISQALYLIASQLSLLALKNVQQAQALTERKQAETALREANQRKDEFLAMLSHELRNPLAPIRNAIQVLRLYGLRDPLLQRQWNLMDRQVTHMGRLLDDLLDVSRITRGKIHLHKEQLDLRLVVDRVLETLRVTFSERSQVLVYSRPPQPITIEADPTRMEQVLSNLLHNAAKYSETGRSIWLQLIRDPSADDSAPMAIIHVRDEGIGMTPEMLPRVFDLFTQAEQTLDRSQGGLGIGLTLVRKLVEMHGGQIEATSAGLGCGSEFTLHLPAVMSESDTTPDEPVSRDEDSPAHPPANAPESTHRRPKVLVVDDSIDTAMSMSELLEIWGYDVSMAYSGPKAVEVAALVRPEIVLLDIGLPGFDGYEVARRLRRDINLGAALLIALTGYGTEEDRHRAHDAGFDHHFAKPVDLQILHEVLNKAATPEAA